MFINRTVGELLFTGYEDPILEIGAAFTEDERTMPIERFGWFYKVRSEITKPTLEWKLFNIVFISPEEWNKLG